MTINLYPIIDGTTYTEECHSVIKFRAPAGPGTTDKEVWGRWCYTHHHWLNDKPAKTVLHDLARTKP